MGSRLTRAIAALGIAGMCAAAIVGFSESAGAAGGPTVTSIAPTSVQPGEIVTVNGSGFLGGCTTDAPTVLLGADTAAVLAGASDIEVRFQVPVVGAGFYDVQVKDCAGEASPPVAADALTVTLPARPKVTSVAPKSGTVGTLYTVTGTNLRLYCTDGRLPTLVFDDMNVLGAEVTLTDGDPLIVSWSSTKIIVHGPSMQAGVIDIIPHDCTGRSAIPSTSDQVTYLAPKVTSVAPTNGTFDTLVTVKGSGFFNGCATGAGPTLSFGAVQLPFGSPDVQSMTATQIVAHAPAHTAGAVPVAVTDCVGDVSAAISAAKFTYNAPKFGKLVPVTGTIGTVVTIDGTGFTNGCTGTSSPPSPAVQFGATLLAPGDPAIVSVSATAIKVVAPTAQAGAVVVRVFDCLGDETALVTSDKFTYTAPKVTSVAPTSGTAGTAVTVKGSGFLIGCSGGALPSVVVDTTTIPGTDPSVSGITATMLIVHVPAHAAGTVDIRIIDCAGDETAIVSTDKFKYV